MKNADSPGMPLPRNISPSSNQAGLTKREIFAGLALQSLINKISLNETKFRQQKDIYYLCKISVDLADGLLNELEESN